MKQAVNGHFIIDFIQISENIDKQTWIGKVSIRVCEWVNCKLTFVLVHYFRTLQKSLGNFK